MRLAAFQLDAAEPPGLDRVGAMLRAAKGAGADLAHLPELALPGYGAGVEALRASAAEAPARLRHLGGLVDGTGIALALGLPFLDGGAVLNGAFVLRPGEAPVPYAKRFLYGDYERAAFAPGRGASPLVEVAGLRVGLLVCFDVEFPETVRELARAGADLVLVPTALPWSEGARFIAERMVPVRAFENGLFLSYADWCGADGAFRYQGLSIVAAPDGRALARAGDAAPAMLLADIDPAAFAQTRAANDYLGELRARG